MIARHHSEAAPTCFWQTARKDNQLLVPRLALLFAGVSEVRAWQQLTSRIRAKSRARGGKAHTIYETFKIIAFKIAARKL